MSRESPAATRNSVDERLRRTKLERTAEEARATSERRRRQTTLALAVAVLRLLLIGGGGAAWYWQKRQADRGRIELALAGAEVLRARAQADSENDPGKWREARQEVEKVAGMVETGTSADIQERFATIKDSVESGMARAESDRELITQIARINAEMEGTTADAAV